MARLLVRPPRNRDRVEEPRQQLWKRLRREAKRVGWLRMLDIFAFRLWYRLTTAKDDARWIASRLDQMRNDYPPIPAATPVLRVASPNSAECQAFLAEARPEIMLALVKSMLAERIFTIPSVGTFVLHPGICPEYRNSHGCFWALAHDDLERVGMTMLRIDRGVDTGPIFGYFRGGVRRGRRFAHPHPERDGDRQPPGNRDPFRGDCDGGRSRQFRSTDGHPACGASPGSPRSCAGNGTHAGGEMPVITLEYHDVIAGTDWNSSGFPGNSANSYKMSAALFDAHLDAVGRIANDTGRDVREIDFARPSAPVVMFTFDDGGSSALHPIADALERHGWRGHFLVERPAALMLGVPDARRPRRAASSRPHRRQPLRKPIRPACRCCRGLTEEREWQRSRQPARGGSRRSGDRRLGARRLFRQCDGAGRRDGRDPLALHLEPESRVQVVDGCVVIGRFTLRQQSSAGVARALVGGWPGARMAQWLKWNAKKVAKRAAGDTYLRVRAARFGDSDR